jgi:hypothetical protein
MDNTPIEPSIKAFPVTDAIEKNTAELAVSLNANDIANAIVADKFDVIEALGVIKAANFYATVSEKLLAETAINIRDTKKYKGLIGKDQNGNPKQVSGFEEFCEMFLGKSARRVQQLMSNYNQLGPDLYEQAERIGFRQRDYNALKALPNDDRLIIAQAIESEDLEKALDLMQQLAAKHHREKETTSKQLVDLTDTLEAKDNVIKDKTKMLDSQAERLAKLENAQRKENDQPVSAEQRLLDARSHLQMVTADIKANVTTRLRKAVKNLYEQELEGDNEQTFMASCLIEIGLELAILRDDYNLPASVSESLMPEWLSQEALDDIKNAGTEA